MGEVHINHVTRAKLHWTWFEHFRLWKPSRKVDRLTVHGLMIEKRSKGKEGRMGEYMFLGSYDSGFHLHL